ALEPTPPEQLAVTHTDPAGATRQPPAPSQVPSWPHAETASGLHSLSGSLPAPTKVHWPTVPGRAQDRHRPTQSPSQQTPSVQNPLAHSRPAPHAVPGVFFFVHSPWVQ